MNNRCLSSFVFVAFAAVASVFGFSLQDGDPLCPPAEQVSPCACFKEGGRVTAFCGGITNSRAINNVFANNPKWKLGNVHFDHCVIDYIPSSIVKTASFQTLNITSSTLNSIFDAAPSKTPEINVYMYDVKILRGVKWELFSNATMKNFGVWNVAIKNLDNSFKNNVPQDMQYMVFENTKMKSIVPQAFQRLVNVKLLSINGGSLKTLSRDMFPNPWPSIKFLSFKSQKLTSLPKDFFTDMPNLHFFFVSQNYFSTISEDIFTKDNVVYTFHGDPIVCNCDIKWIIEPTKLNTRVFLGTCASPKTFAGRDMTTLTEDEFRYCQ